MTTVNTNLFKKFRKLTVRQEGDGDETKVEVREDEEQSEKFQEIIDLLVAAGYFRARIKGLTPFDKVVGGMTWCIESCNMDIDVDLLFQESSTIGQKISLTEKIVAVLPKMKCPHRIEPHQIQGLDFIHIFPVIQWLVKRSMEFRQERAEFVRSYAVNQFNKTFTTKASVPEKQQTIENLNIVNDAYRPRRFYKRKTALPVDLTARVQITLLEYGLYRTRNRSSRPSSESDATDDQNNELQMQQLLSNMAISNEVSSDFNELSAEERGKLLRHYTELQQEIGEGSTKTKEEKHLQFLQQQKILLEEQLNRLSVEKDSIQTEIAENENQLETIKQKQQEAAKTLKELEASVSDFDNAPEVEDLVKLNDSLRQQEVQFKEQCKKELAELERKIEEARNITPPKDNEDQLNQVLERDTEKLKALRLHLAKKNRVISVLQRQLDEVPSRPELAQYQRRFLELYNQVAAKHKETKQYFTLYNTLEDTKGYMHKELSLLNSISDNYPEAMSSSASRDEFLKQFENIVESVKQSKKKIEQRLVEEKFKRDQLSSRLQGLVELQRRYVAAVRQLSIECKKFETLSAQQRC